MIKYRKHILFIHHSGNKGGAPRSLALIINNLSELINIKKTVFSIRKGPGNKAITKIASRHIVGKLQFPFHTSESAETGLKNFFRNILSFLSAFVIFPAYAFMAKKVDLIYLNSPSMVFHGLVTKLMNPSAKVICHIREPARNNLSSRFVASLLEKYVDKFIAISSYDANSWFPTGNEKLEVIYNYISVPDEIACERNKLSTITFGYLARFRLDNGLGLIVDTARQLESREDIRFKLIGYTGHEDKAVRDLISQNTGELRNLEVLPMVDDINAAIRGFDVLLVPFLKPHFSRSVVECGAFKLPSICSDVGQLKEQVIDHKTGLLVKVGSLKSLITAIKYYADNPDVLRAHGVNAKRFIKSNFGDENGIKIRNIIVGYLEG